MTEAQVQAPQTAGTGPAGGPSWQAAAGTAGRSAVARLTELESGSVIAATILLIAVVGAFRPGFLSPGQLKQVVQQASFIGLLAVGTSFLLAMREIDLSIGSMFGLTLICGALLDHAGMNPWLAAPVCVLAGAGQCAHRRPADHRAADQQLLLQHPRR
jgi:ribose transport system permease protein